MDSFVRDLLHGKVKDGNRIIIIARNAHDVIRYFHSDDCIIPEAKKDSRGYLKTAHQLQGIRKGLIILLDDYSLRGDIQELFSLLKYYSTYPDIAIVTERGERINFNESIEEKIKQEYLSILYGTWGDKKEIPSNTVLRYAMDTAKAQGLNPETSMMFAIVELHKALEKTRIGFYRNNIDCFKEIPLDPKKIFQKEK